MKPANPGALPRCSRFLTGWRSSVSTRSYAERMRLASTLLRLGALPERLQALRCGIETTFNLPADSQGGGIANVSGILMKQSEQARGAELAGTRR